MAATIRHWGYPRCRAKNCWRCVEADFQNRAVTVWLTPSPSNVASMLVMARTDHVTIQLPYLQHSKSLMLHWRSFSGWGSEHDNIIFGLEGSQYLVYEWLQPFATEITQNAQPTTVDALLTLISSLGQWQYSLLFCQEWLRVCWIRIAATTSPSNYPTKNSNHRWSSVDAHFDILFCQDLLPIMIVFMIIWT